MTTIKKNTKKAAEIIQSTLYDLGSILEAYGRPSSRKIAAYNEIEDRAKTTPGYNHDLHVCAAGSSFFSTAYSFTDEAGTTIIVKDTPSYTYLVEC